MAFSLIILLVVAIGTLGVWRCLNAYRRGCLRKQRGAATAQQSLMGAYGFIQDQLPPELPPAERTITYTVSHPARTIRMPLYLPQDVIFLRHEGVNYLAIELLPNPALPNGPPTVIYLN